MRQTDRYPLVIRTVLPSIVLLLAAAGAAAGPVLDRIKSKGTLVIAHRESSVPFSYLDADKKPVGYAVDLCLKLADAIKKKLGVTALKTEYLMVTPQNRIAAIAEGKADLECGSTTNNAERRKQVAFTVPHYITGARYMVRADSPITVLAQFEGKKLVSTKGTTPLKAIDQANRDQLLRINILEAPDHGKAVQMVESGEADGFAMDDVLLYGLIAGRPDPSKLKVIGKFLTIEPLAIMLSKDDPDLKRVVDDEMKRLISSREANKIYERWFAQPIPPKNTALNLPMNYLLKDFWKYPTDQVPN
ncbi:amino acid ABC transporter substrate-binding protein [Aquincola sp. S2]|uniref:Amino acid ABC transporter substrate-binding protein n=1 Tax=Pseudaquabacterium terrae TaxID=2732868 RepID=A0ABX2EKY7_9BURK|nr:amino acid ABC transporter substrate-binding protein [Aquabacterium terrae]